MEHFKAAQELFNNVLVQQKRELKLASFVLPSNTVSFPSESSGTSVPQEFAVIPKVDASQQSVCKRPRGRKAGKVAPCGLGVIDQHVGRGSTDSATQ